MATWRACMIAAFALAVSPLASAQSPVGDAFLELRGLTGRSLEAACDRLVAQASDPSQQVRHVGGDVIAHGLFVRASARDRLTLARLMARLGDPFNGGYPFLTMCGNGMSEASWFRMRESLAKALALEPTLVPRLLRDRDPVVAEAVVGESGKEHDSTIRRALLIWSGSANPRFRALAAFYMKGLAVDERLIVIDRMLDDPDPLLRREAVTFVDGDTARAAFPRLRYGFENGSASRKIGILHLGFRAADLTVSRELAFADIDPSPEVKEAAKEVGQAMKWYRNAGSKPE